MNKTKEKIATGGHLIVAIPSHACEAVPEQETDMQIQEHYQDWLVTPSW